MQTQQYDDIMNRDYPYLSKHPRMQIADRAKIFAPFAALKGYEEEIAAKQKIVVPKIELTDDSKEMMNQKITEIHRQLGEGRHPIVTVVYFKKDRLEDEEGEYIRFTGKTVKFNPDNRIIQLVDRRISLDDIYDIEISQ